MRKILFRGKTDKGEWVYGDLLHPDLYGNCYAIEDFAKEKNNCFDVIPETVGQFTGLYDRTKWEDLSTKEQAEFLYHTNGGKRKKEDWKGKPIFEGDIVKYKHTDGISFNGVKLTVTGKVIYNEKNASFAVDGKDEIGAKSFDYFPIKNIEVIGNIHDNPELLGGGE